MDEADVRGTAEARAPAEEIASCMKEDRRAAFADETPQSGAATTFAEEASAIDFRWIATPPSLAPSVLRGSLH